MTTVVYRNFRKEITENNIFSKVVQKLQSEQKSRSSHNGFRSPTNVSLIIHPRSHRPLIRGSMEPIHVRVFIRLSEYMVQANIHRAAAFAVKASLQRSSSELPCFSTPNPTSPYAHHSSLLSDTSVQDRFHFPPRISSNVCSRTTKRIYKTILIFFLGKEREEKCSGSQSEVFFSEQLTKVIYDF